MLPARSLPALFLVLAVACVAVPNAARAQDAAAFAGRTWLLDGIAARPAEGARAKAVAQQVGRTHPVGRTFLELRADGTFTLLRGEEARAVGGWTFAGAALALQRRDGAGAAVGAPLRYAVAEAGEKRLVLTVPLPVGMPEVRLDFSPARMPR